MLMNAQQLESSPYNTSFQAIILMVLREWRLEQNIPQASAADRIHKTPATLAKVESGKSAMSMELFIALCGALGAAPSRVFTACENIASGLTQHGWQVSYNVADKLDQDYLLTKCFEYRANNPIPPHQRTFHPGYATPNSILWTPHTNAIGQFMASDVFMYLIDRKHHPGLPTHWGADHTSTLL